MNFSYSKLCDELLQDIATSKFNILFLLIVAYIFFMKLLQYFIFNLFKYEKFILQVSKPENDDRR